MASKISEVRRDFPILTQMVNDEPLVYLDSAATSQKPKTVLDAVATYYQTTNANVHRGVYVLAQQATQAYEEVRQKVATYLNAPSSQEVVYTKGTTQSINWIAQGYFAKVLQPGDEIVVSYLEHHSNLVPWQQVAKQTGAKLVYLNLTEQGRLDLQDAREKITAKTAVVALGHVSNVLGVINPIAQLSQLAHANGALMVVDGAQAVGHIPVDVQALGADFYAFSGHKMLAPTGIGVLWGHQELLEQMEPLEFGGEMIEFVDLQESTFKPVPYKFEGGTQNIAGVIGLGAALDYLQQFDLTEIKQHEQALVKQALAGLKEIPGISLYGPLDTHERGGIISFNLNNLHPHDTATALDMEGVAVRAGHHCAQPLMRYLKTPATVRASFYLYNTPQDVSRLIDAVWATKEFFENGPI